MAVTRTLGTDHRQLHSRLRFPEQRFKLFSLISKIKIFFLKMTGVLVV